MQDQGGEIQAWDVEESFHREVVSRRRHYVTRFLRIAEKLYMLVGGDNDYILVEGLYCSCPLFQRGLMEGRAYCHHLAGLNAAIKKRMIDALDLDSETVKVVVMEVLSAGFSVEVRRLLASMRGRA